MTALAVTGAVVDGEVVGVRVSDGVVVALGSDVEPEAGDDVLDGEGCAVVPGLVNGHTHAAMTLFRGYGDDLPLMEWLRSRIWPAEARVTAEDAYWGTRFAAQEMARSGTVAFWDMYWHGPAVARAAVDSGVRAVISTVFFDGLDPASADRAATVDILDEVTEVAAGSDGRVMPGLGPHAVYTVSADALAWLAGIAAERDLPVQIHLSETEQEVTDCLATHGVRPAVLLDSVGLLGPRTVLAHGCWLDDAELDLVAERGATIVTNPVSNMKLTVGRVFPHRRAAAAGVSMGLGTDGAASNNNLDLLEETKFLALVQKHDTGDASAMPASEALAIATGQRSALLGGQPVRVGAPADFSLVRLRPHLVPGDLEANLVYAANGGSVDSTVVAGRVVVRHGRVDDDDEVVARAAEAAVRVTG